MDRSNEQKFAALLAAVENRDAESITEMWRGMTALEQEAVVFRLLGVPEAPTDRPAESTHAYLDDPHEPDRFPAGDETAIQADQTELIPKSVDDLRGLTGSDADDAPGTHEVAAVRFGSTEYWSRWRQRWKWSVLVTVWAMATVFAFSGAFDAFGPMEWVVGILASVVCSGLLIGTLANFVVAVIAPTTPRSRQRT